MFVCSVSFALVKENTDYIKNKAHKFEVDETSTVIAGIALVSKNIEDQQFSVLGEESFCISGDLVYDTR